MKTIRQLLDPTPVEMKTLEILNSGIFDKGIDKHIGAPSHAWASTYMTLVLAVFIGIDEAQAVIALVDVARMPTIDSAPIANLTAMHDCM